MKSEFTKWLEEEKKWDSENLWQMLRSAEAEARFDFTNRWLEGNTDGSPSWGEVVEAEVAWEKAVANGEVTWR